MVLVPQVIKRKRKKEDTVTDKISTKRCSRNHKWTKAHLHNESIIKTNNLISNDGYQVSMACLMVYNASRWIRSVVNALHHLIYVTGHVSQGHGR